MSGDKEQFNTTSTYCRVRNSANPCVRDMPKYLRTCQMSVHGYPADMSIFCNLQLGLLKLQEDTPQADIYINTMYLLLARCKVQLPQSWSRSLIPPCSRATLLGDNTRFSRRDVGQSMQWGRRFPNPSASRGSRFCSSWNRLLCSLLVMFLRARCCLVGAFSCSYIQRQLPGTQSQTGADVTLTVWQLKHCDTFCSMAYIFKGHVNNIRKWLFIFENIIDRCNTMFKN